MYKVKHRHRPLETRYGPVQSGPRLVPVQASWDRSGAGLGRLVPVSLGPGAAERSQETLNFSAALDPCLKLSYKNEGNQILDFKVIENFMKELISLKKLKSNAKRFKLNEWME